MLLWEEGHSMTSPLAGAQISILLSRPVTHSFSWSLSSSAGSPVDGQTSRSKKYKKTLWNILLVQSWINYVTRGRGQCRKVLGNRKYIATLRFGLFKSMWWYAPTEQFPVDVNHSYNNQKVLVWKNLMCNRRRITIVQRLSGYCNLRGLFSL